jgi:2-keto-4-pentenoate hydratase
MSATATTVKAATGRQRQTIADLARELSYTDVPEPRSTIHASAIIQRLIEDRDTAGVKLAPTSRQLRMLERLGAERGKDYKVPVTRAQASAKISQILSAGAPDEQEAVAA